MTETIKIGGELESTATGNKVADVANVKDKTKGNKSQAQINDEFGTALEDRYTKDQTYSKSELNNMITTPNQEYVTVTATDQTTDITDVLSATGEANTVYRVGNWDGSQYDPTVYSEYAWNGSQYVHLSTKTQIEEVFDISAYHATGGTLTKYADLTAALDGGDNIPQSLRKGGMNIKFVQSSDNKYVQYFLISDEWSTDENDWEKINNEKEVEAVNDVLYNEDPNHQLVQHFASGNIQMSSFADAVPFELKAGRYTISAEYSVISQLSCYLYDSEGTNILGNGITIQNLVGGKVFSSDIAKIGFYGTASSEGNVTITFVNVNPKKGLIEKVEEMEDVLSDIDEVPTEDSEKLVKSGGVFGAIKDVKDNVDSLDEDMESLIGEDYEQINLSPYISDAHNGIINYSTGDWVNITSSYQHIIVPVLSGVKYLLLAKQEGALSLRYAPLKSYSGTYNAPDYCNGYSNITAVAKGTEVEFTAPSDCNYLYLQYKDGGNTASLEVTKEGADGEVQQIEKEILSINKNLNLQSIWKNKKIAWYGTSIPAGTSLAIPFEGNQITALLSASTIGRYPSGRIVETDGESSPHEYPIMVGTLLGADVYNEAVGSSKAGKSYVGSKTDLYLYCKSLANSVKYILDVISNCYTIDWTNHTVIRNGSNDYGITSFFSTDIENSWSDFCGKVLECVSFSYEIAIVSRYLISDNTEHASYVQRIFDTYYSSVVDNLNLDALCGFKADIDMFVFDHGCNDGRWASSSTTPISEGILSNDPTTFEGAYNLFFNTIYRYKANARIVIIGSYYNWQPNVAINRIDVQKAIAERWQFPFIDMSKFMPAAINITVLTNGYWEDVSRSGVTMGKWHERGFTYNNSTGENNNDMFSHYSLTKAQIESIYEPQQIDGVWYWKAPMMKLWCYDEPHPHSDSEGRMSKILTRLLSAHLEDIGNI